MHKRMKYGRLSSCFLTGILTLSGCTVRVPDVVKENIQEDIVTVKQEETTYLGNLENSYNVGELDEAGLIELAKAYQEENRLMESRNRLEECYRLYKSEEAFQLLQTITVNVEEESDSLQNMYDEMLAQVSLVEEDGNAIALFLNADWHKKLMPKLYEGQRNYYKQQDGNTSYLAVGYDMYGVAFVKVWVQSADLRICFLEVDEDRIRFFKTGIVNGKYDGEFTSIVCDGYFGDVSIETGVLKDGLITGEYQMARFSGKGEAGLTALWNERNNVPMTYYKGTFEAGKSLEEQQVEDLVIYAYDETREICLYTEELGVLDHSFFGLASMPEMTMYEPVYIAYLSDENIALTDNLDVNGVSDQVKVRVYDGVVQLYQNGRWTDVASVDDMVNADPFMVYEKQHQEIAAQRESGIYVGANSTGQGTDDADGADTSDENQGGMDDGSFGGAVASGSSGIGNRYTSRVRTAQPVTVSQVIQISFARNNPELAKEAAEGENAAESNGSVSASSGSNTSGSSSAATSSGEKTGGSTSGSSTSSGGKTGSSSTSSGGKTGSSSSSSGGKTGSSSTSSGGKTGSSSTSSGGKTGGSTSGSSSGAGQTTQPQPQPQPQQSQPQPQPQQSQPQPQPQQPQPQPQQPQPQPQQPEPQPQPQQPQQPQQPEPQQPEPQQPDPPQNQDTPPASGSDDGGDNEGEAGWGPDFK